MSSTRLNRSSQTVSVVANKAWIFGGEVLPRQPIDNHFDIVDLSECMQEAQEASISCVSTLTLCQLPHLLELYILLAKGQLLVLAQPVPCLAMSSTSSLVAAV